MAEKLMQWVCDICGYLHDEPEPPDNCPVCGAPKAKFSELSEESVDEFDEFSDDEDELDWEADDDENSPPGRR